MQTVRVAACGLVIFHLTLVGPSSTAATSCGGTASSAESLRSADVVFVGTIARLDPPRPWRRVNPGGLVSIGISSSQPATAYFNVERQFKGKSARLIVVLAETSVPFKDGETWLVYARDRDGVVTTDVCRRTRLKDAASQDLLYLEGLAQGREQGLVHGEVLRRVMGDEGHPVLKALFEPLQVVAVGAGRRFETTTDKWGPFQLVLTPGDFEIWVERNGRPVRPRQAIRVESKSEQRLTLAVEYED